MPKSVIEKAFGIHIKNEVFDSNNNFNFFEKNNQCLVYGENGSGKTVLSKAFNQLKEQSATNGNEENVKPTVYLTDENKKNVNYKSLNLSKNIFVFNEKFTHEKLGLKTDLEGLNSIVLLGEDVNLDKEISEKNKTLEDLNEEQQDLTKRSEQAKKDISALKTKITNKIKEIEWEENNNKIEATKRTNLTDSRLNKITAYKDHVSKKAFEIRSIENEFQTKLATFTNLDTIEEKQNLKQYQQEIDDENLQEINKLLSEEIKTETLSPREEQIKSILEGKQKDLISISRNYFKENNTAHCPFCLQEVNDDYKTKLLQEIEKVFSIDAIKTLKKSLDSYKSQLKNICQKNSPNKQIEDYTKKYKDTLSADENELLTEIENITLPINKFYTDLLIQIEDKIKNPYEIFKIENNLTSLINVLNKKINKFNSKVNNFNSEIKEQKEQKKESKIEFHELNNKITCYYIKDDHNSFLEKEKENSDLESKISKNKEKVDSITKEINGLEAKKSNTGLAAEKINDDLKLIFLAKGRLSLELNTKNNQYEVLSNNKAIKPSQLSSGERNAISLCYFFYKICSDCNADEMYKNSSIFIIDDPITSFDINNQMGIYSFLRSKFKQIYEANNNNKIIMLTHNGFAMFQMQRIFYNILKNKYATFHLKNKVLETIDNNFNTYGMLLKDVYRYANIKEAALKSDIYSRTIGNIIRRVLESFSTLIYNAKFNIMLNDPNLFPEKEKEKIEKIIPNYFLELLANEESHLENITKTATDTNIIDSFITEEKQMAAKITIILLYKINKTHVENFLISNKKDSNTLKDKEELKNTINKWKKEINY